MQHLKRFELRKLVLGVAASTLFGGSAIAASLDDEHLNCGADHAHSALYKKFPEIKAKQAGYKAQEELSLKFTQASLNNPNQNKLITNYTIPTVFHVIHAGGAENITDAQIQEAINQLNEDYNGNDVRKDLIFDEFKSIYANVGMSFVLARKDPNGNPTDGITRHYAPNEVTQFNDASDQIMKAKYAWPQEKYLNIYVIRSAGGQSGSAWAFYPSQVDDPSTKDLDGVISSHWAIGRTGTATPTHWKILTHEIGHWANLAHTFENYCAEPGDSVADTPPTLAGSGCDKVWSPCGNGIVNTQNYMDYGFCTSMFTNGQQQRMMTAMNSTVAGRNNIYTQQNLIDTGVVGMPVNAMFNIEQNVIVPGDKITFNDVSEAETGSITSWQWNFPGGTPSSFTGKNPPAITYNTAGTYAATLTVSNGADSNTVTKQDYITVTSDLVMRNDVVRSCSAKFYDSGNNHTGLAGDYGNREDHTLVMLPNQSNSAVKVDFNDFILENSSNCDLDFLKIYDGLDESAPMIGQYCGKNSPGSVTATNGAGALTFVFHSNVKARTAGWDANVSCTAGQGGGNIAPIANANGDYNIKATVVTEFSSAGSKDIDGDIVTYNWNFGDGNSSAAANPNHAYAAVGNYNASLTVTDNNGSSTTQQFVVNVRANQPDPLVVEANGPYQAKEEQGIDFSSVGTFDLDTEITGYAWDFGDGNTSSFHTPTHTYSVAGNYTVTLTVTNADGVTASDTAQVTIDPEPGDTPPPMIDACSGGTTPMTSGTIEAGVPTCIGNDGDNWTSFSFSGADSFRSAAITLAHGDGDPSLYVRKNSWPTQTQYDASSTNAGSYECIYLRHLPDYWNYLAVKDGPANGITITVDYNTSGCRAVGANIDPTASFTAPSSAEVGQAVSFDGSSSSDPDGTIVGYAWDFGDGQSATGSSPIHTYATAGTYAVTLTVTDNRDGTATATQSINITTAVNDPPIANANGPYTVNLGDTLIFDSTGSSDPEGKPLTYAWDFGDGASGSGASPSHTYAAIGTYNIGLTVTDDGGLTASSSATVTVSEPPPPSYCSSQGGGTYEWISNVAVGSFHNSSGSSAYSDFTAQEITLNEGDNSISLTAGGGYTEHWKIWIDFNRDGDFEDAGEVVVSGLSGKDTVTGNINIPSSANFVKTRMRIAMKYSSEATSPCGDFGDGETEDYTVNLVANGGGNNLPPTANANGPYTALTGEAISFSSAGSIDTDGTIDTYLWEFGDGNTSNVATPTHTYTTANNYTVTLTVTDNQGASATSSTTATITEDTGGNPPVYCDASGGGSYEWIANVATGNFSNPSGAAPYTDYTAQTIELVTGSNNMALTAGGGYTESWKIWIDYNVDGDFNDPGETVLSGLSGKDTVNGSINVPASANGTTTRMRVAMKYNGEPSSSCGDFGDGEVEDYTVSISQGSTNPPGGGTCGATTNDGGALLFDQVECVNRTSPGKYSYYIYVENDATQMYITTSGGTGDVDIYYNADTWAGSDNYQYSSTLVGNEQTLAVNANKGYRYITLETDSEFADVNLVVSLTAPTGSNGEDNTTIGQGGSGTTDANDPDCQLADTPTNDPVINMYTFESSNNVTENFFEGWVRVRGTSVNSNYQLKFCPATYGGIKLGNRSETLDPNHYGKEFEYNYKHWGARATNVENIKTIAIAEDGSKAVMTLQLQLQNPTVEHPVQPSCDDLTLDADFDGIPDCAEEPGKTFYTMPLYDWGARKNQLDIFIEVDYMDKHPLKDYDGNYVYDDNGNQIIDHGTEPKRKVLDIVKDVYAARGIHIHFDIGNKFDQAPGLDPLDYDLGGGQAIPFMEYIHLARWTDYYNGREIPVPGMDEDVMPQYFFNNPERDKIFYYVLFANSQGGANRGSSGQAPDLFDRFMYISMGGTGWGFTDDTPENENMMINGHASTVVHELGHIFGLSHDGFPDDTARNFKLNYPSAMNYLFQLQGGPTDKFADIDYSTMVRERYYLWQNPGLNYACNDRLNETNPGNTTWGNLVHGLRSDPADFHIGYSDGLQPKIDETQTAEGLLEGGLDLNCDGNINNYVGPTDVNHDGQIDFLWDYDDWGYLTFFYHYYNYDVKNEYDIHNEFLLEPNYHVKWAYSPTDVKYPNLKNSSVAKFMASDSKEGSLNSQSTHPKTLSEKRAARIQKIRQAREKMKGIPLSELQKQSKELIGVKEAVLPPAAQEAIRKAQAESRRMHRANKEKAEAQN